MVQFLSSVLESLGSHSRVAKGKQAVTEAGSCDLSSSGSSVCDHDEGII